MAVVTGGGSGLGAALVAHLSEAGAVPVVLDLRAARVDASVERVRSAGGRADGWVCDVGEPEQVDKTFAAVADRFGRVDLLVNCAGRSMLRSFMDMSNADVDWVLGPNLLGVVHCMRAAVPLMRPGSWVVNVTSVSGRVPTPGEAFYSAAKAAVVSLSESLEAELAGRGIGITVVLPGEMSTNLFGEHPSWERRPRFQRWMEVDPSKVARATLRGVAAGRFEVVHPRYMKAVLLFQRAAPTRFRHGVRGYWRSIEKKIAVEP